MNISFFIYDERFYSDPDSATVYEVCESLKEAREAGPDYGGHVIVKTYAIENPMKKGSFTITKQTIVT